MSVANQRNTVSVADLGKHHPLYPAALSRSVGRAIKERRVAADMTQASLATKGGLSRGSIANIERGEQTVAVPVLLRIADALQVDACSLLLEPSDRDWQAVGASIGAESKAKRLLRGVQSLDAEDRDQQVKLLSDLIDQAKERS